MSEFANLKKTVSQVIVELFREKLGDSFFKEIRSGDPGVPAASRLPALYVTEIETENDTGPTGFDRVTHQIVIQVVLNKKDDIGRPDSELTLNDKVDAVMQGRDATTGLYLDTSIMGILRRNYTLGNLILESVGTIVKGQRDRDKDLTTVEAILDLTVIEDAPIDNRS